MSEQVDITQLKVSRIKPCLFKSCASRSCALPGPCISLVLILGQVIFITLAEFGLGILLIYDIFLLGQGRAAHAFDLSIGLNPFTLNLVYITISIALIDLISGIRMYRYSLFDGMVVRI